MKINVEEMEVFRSRRCGERKERGKQKGKRRKLRICWRRENDDNNYAARSGRKINSEEDKTASRKEE